MFASLLPGLRQLRAPLASGAAWLAVVWLWWGRHLPSRDEATGLLSDVYELTEHVGIAAVTAAMAFCAYIVGEVWEAIRGSHPAFRTTQIAEKAVSFPAFSLAPSRISKTWSAHGLLGFFTDSKAIFGDLFPNLGVKRPDSLNDEQKNELLEAMWRDINRAVSLTLDRDPELMAIYERASAEYWFRRLLAFPLGLAVGSATAASTSTWQMTVVGILVGAALWFTLNTQAQQKNGESVIAFLGAMYHEKLPCPALTEAGLRLFGPDEAGQSRTSNTGSVGYL
ncbi:hypothetical protein Snas_0320 [Stackebrandtia nassauensis DSM 44728]|uniref:Uncharacterized protein n=2 Tax=Stackebrandtia TaxID=283810 RepID=D3Q368_STANL|nr:hypothetical protein Snas_0320 [Stackebrandtia nassauensis DSM 44728]